MRQSDGVSQFVYHPSKQGLPEPDEACICWRTAVICWHGHDSRHGTVLMTVVVLFLTFDSNSTHCSVHFLHLKSTILGSKKVRTYKTSKIHTGKHLNCNCSERDQVHPKNVEKIWQTSDAMVRSYTRAMNIFQLIYKYIVIRKNCAKKTYGLKNIIKS